MFAILYLSYRIANIPRKGGDAKMANIKGLKSGEKTPVSGEYKNTRTGTEVTSVRGEPLPPGPKGSKFNLVDTTKHKK